MDIVYGPTETEAVSVSAFDETIGETKVNERNEKAMNAIKTPTFEKTSLLCVASFIRIPTS
jgi:hypothetical protein